MDGAVIIIAGVAIMTFVVFYLRYLQKVGGGRSCPQCGHRQAHEDPECHRCGFDFSMR